MNAPERIAPVDRGFEVRRDGAHVEFHVRPEPIPVWWRWPMTAVVFMLSALVGGVATMVIALVLGLPAALGMLLWLTLWWGGGTWGALVSQDVV